MMFKVNAEDVTGTFSRLIPASSSVAFRPLGQLRDRIVTASCLGASKSSQSSGSPDEDLVNKMLTVESNYTACIGSQVLCGKVRVYLQGGLDVHRPGFETQSSVYVWCTETKDHI